MEALDLVAALLVLTGLLGVLLPVLPSTPLVFLGALLLDYTREWTALGWGWLALLFVLMLISVVADWWVSTVGAKRGGASWRALMAGVVLGFAGLFLLPPFGFIIGSVGGVVGVELLTARDARRALRAGSGWLIGWVLSLILEGTIAVAMVAIILWEFRG